MRMGIGDYYEKKSGVVLRYIFMALAAFVLIIIWASINIRPMIISVAKGYAENAVANTVNELIESAMSEEEYSFLNIINDSEGRVTAVTMNSADTNLLMTKLTLGLKNKIHNMEEIKADIPLGNFLPYPFFAGLGPDIKVRFLLLANTKSETEETFDAKGINQTLYTLSVNVDTDVGIYIPTMYTRVSVRCNIPLARTLVVGSVPESYTNIEGLEGTAQDAAINLG